MIVIHTFSAEVDYGRKPVKVTDLTFRDGHQSLFATRMKTHDMIPIAEKMDGIGFYSMEVWAAQPST